MTPKEMNKCKGCGKSTKPWIVNYCNMECVFKHIEQLQKKNEELKEIIKKKDARIIRITNNQLHIN